MNCLGIDISKSDFKVYLNGLRGSFENNPKGFKALISWLKNKKSFINLHACLESTGRYSLGLAHFLFEKSIKVSIVNPRLVKDFASSQGKRNKTDEEDAETIARFCEINKPVLWKPDSEIVSRLIELTRTVEDLKKQKYSIQNRLEYQTDRTVQISLNKVIKSIDNEIEKLEKEIKKLLSEDDDLNNKTDLLTSIPGFGEQTAGIILAETKGQPEKFVSSRALAAYAGLTPARK